MLVHCLHMKITTCLLVLINQLRKWDNSFSCELVSSLSAYESCLIYLEQSCHSILSSSMRRYFIVLLFLKGISYFDYQSDANDAKFIWSWFWTWFWFFHNLFLKRGANFFLLLCIWSWREHETNAHYAFSIFIANCGNNATLKEVRMGIKFILNQYQ